MPELIIYGATGYSGRLVSEEAKRKGLDFLIAGRTETHLRDLGASLSVEYRVFDLANLEKVETALQGARVLVNCAGPYVHTGGPLINVCIKKRIHYLDISAEVEHYKLIEERDQGAIEAGIMLLPGSGGGVAILGSLVARAVQFAEHAMSIDVALYVAGAVSRGTAITGVASSLAGFLRRVDGKLVRANGIEVRKFDFDNGEGMVDCALFGLPDVITSWRTTRVDNMTTYVHTPKDGFLGGDPSLLPDGPTVAEREANPYHAAVIVTSQDGSTRHAVLHTVNGYTFTATATVEAARRVLSGNALPGFQTPVSVFGIDFAETIPGTTIQVL
ncbi:hypothetical protein F5Y19DRAFT_486037 [Xylariaceae sp. FL1651]|nr:hypothetical protein F5Y19DRAFT_486037 [Xylariaceae sp. FL1651]